MPSTRRADRQKSKVSVSWLAGVRDAFENVKDGAITGVSKFDQSEEFTVGREFVLAENIDGSLALLSGEREVGVQSEHAARIEPFSAHCFGVAIGNVGAEVAVVRPHVDLNNVSRLSQVELH